MVKRKRFSILIVFFISLCFCTSAAASTSLLLSHAVNVPLSYRLSFREYTDLNVSGEEITEKSFTSGGRYIFASLVLSFNRTMMFDSISVSFSDLVNTSDNTKYYGYEMEVLVPGDDTTHLIEVEEAAGGHGSGVARLVSSATSFKRTSTGDTEDRRIADFAITLYEDGVAEGTYSGTMTLSFVAN